MSNAAPKSPGVSRWLPALGWLRIYEKAWLRGDVVAGITLGAYLLPAGLGDASLANLPPEAGLYACLFGGLVFWLFCCVPGATHQRGRRGGGISKPAAGIMSLVTQRDRILPLIDFIPADQIEIRGPYAAQHEMPSRRAKAGSS